MKLFFINSAIKPFVRCSAITLLISFCVVNAACTVDATSNELEDFKSAIRAKYDMKEQAFADNDPDPVLNRFYSADVISTGPEGRTYIGREELRPVYSEIISATVRIESFNSFVNGDAGWDWVNFHVVPPAAEGAAPFTFKMLFLWERIAGEWWSHGEMYVIGEFELAK